MFAKVVPPLLLITQLCSPAAWAATSVDQSICKTVQFPYSIQPPRATYTLSPDTTLVTDLYTTADSVDDYGQRLMLYTREGGVNKLRYYSSGSSDSYILNPTFYKDCAGYALLILAEIGTEYSWGVRVFGYRHGKVTDLGEIPLAVDTRNDSESDSITPYVSIHQENGTAVITFQRNVVRDPGGREQQSFSAGKIKYLLHNGRLLEVTE